MNVFLWQRLSTGVRVGNSDAVRQRLVVLGTGWGSYSVLRHVNKNLFDVIVISPRNHFLFTPLLASTTVGTLEFRSIIEPIRNTGFRNEQHFHLSVATGLDTDRQVVQCVSSLDPTKEYEVAYDKLVIGVGAVPNDFNVPGVKEHAFFLKVPACMPTAYSAVCQSSQSNFNVPCKKCSRSKFGPMRLAT